ncbi:MAG: CHRD domain-containing protein [Bacteroidota bacterium]
MKNSKTKGYVRLCVAFVLFFLVSCEKELSTEAAKVKPPVRTYIVTARADKKGTNSTSIGAAVLKGQYDEETKQLSYNIDYSDIEPQLITLRSGAKGTVGTFIKDLYNKHEGSLTVIKGAFSLTPLQERNLLKGLWFVTVSTSAMSPEISGVLTLKQQ